MKIELKDYECVVNKYQIITDEKKDSLGQRIKLKDLLDLGGDYIYVADKDNKDFCGCYKCCNGEYDFSFENNDKEYDENELLNKMVYVETYFDYDGDNYPVVCCKFIN